MDGYNGFNGYQAPPDFEDETKSTALPKWVWVVGILGLAFAILCGYYTGIYAGEYFNELIKTVIIEDVNGESTELNTLDFTDFLGVYDDYYGYNKFDAGLFATSYDSSSLYDNSLGTYKNEFSETMSARLKVSFKNLNYYDVSYVYEGNGSKLSYSVEFNLQKGNMEAAIVRLARNFTVETDEFGISNIKHEYIQIIDRISSEKVSSVPMEDGYIYIIVFAGESASGSYSLDVNIS